MGETDWVILAAIAAVILIAAVAYMLVSVGKNGKSRKSFGSASGAGANRKRNADEPAAVTVAEPAERGKGVKAALRRFMDGKGQTHIAKKKHRMMVLFLLAAVLAAV